MGLQRNARRHRTAGIDSSDWSTYQVGQRVMTPEGFAGVITEVLDGPFPQTEAYEVILDAGMGGGTYGISELRPIEVTTAAAETRYATADERRAISRGDVDLSQHVASEDYPELAQILVDRPPLAHAEPLLMTAAARVAQTDEDAFWSEGSIEKAAAIPLECGVCGQTYFTDSLDEKHGCEPDISNAGLVVGYDGDLVAVPDTAVPLPPTPPLIVDDPSPEAAMADSAEEFEAYVQDVATDAAIQGHYSDVPALPDVALQAEAGWLWDNLVAPAVDAGTSYLDEKNTRSGPDGMGSWSYDWCRFRRDRHCWYPDQMDMAATQQAGYAVFIPVDRGICGRDRWEDQKACSLAQPGPKSGDPGALLDATVPWQQGGQRGGVPVYSSRLQVEAAFEFTAAWADVRAKASEIRSAGGGRIVSVSGDMASGRVVTGEIRGSSSVYETSITSEPGRQSVAMWSCGCPWAAYSWGRSGRWKKYEGRMCSHALALTYETQARGMFGRNVIEDAEAPEWSSGDVQRPGDYVAPPRKSAALRPVALDADLAPSVAAWMARDMLHVGQAAEARAYFGDAIVSEAATLDFGGRLRLLWNGVVRRVQEIDAAAGVVYFDDGQEAPVNQVHYETYDPSTGLNFSGSLTLTADDSSPFEGDDLADEVEDAVEDAQEQGHDVEEAVERVLEDHDESLDDMEAVLHDEPAPALPSTEAEDEDDGDVAAPAPGDPRLAWLMKGDSRPSSTGRAGAPSDGDIAAAAKEALAKMALKDFTPAERAEIIDEGIGVRASNFDSLDIRGTHYEGLDDDEDEVLDL